MLRETFRQMATLAFMFSLSSTAVWAQVGEAGSGTVSGMGMVSVKQKPTLLRMTIQLQEKGKTVEESLAKLKDRRDAAVLQLQGFGARKSDIVASDPTLSAGKTDEEQRMQQMMMQQMRARGRAPKALQLPKSVTTTSTLTVEWPLSVETNEELLLFANTLQDKIEAADLAGRNEPKKLTPEEEELQEEMQEMMSGYGGYGNNQPKPGEPNFLYVARISEDERDKALAAAFDKAKDQAQRLAAAAHANLGKLSSLSGGTSQSNEGEYGYNPYAVQMMRAAAATSGSDEHEAMVASPGMITFQVIVNATFRLE